MTFPTQSASETTTPAALMSPYLHPLQSHKVRETHKANVETNYATGRKLINHYEIIEELGRGVHGKVKLARNMETGENVAIKIIPRFSKKRRLGKVTAMSTQDKSKREIAILKKIRHPNVVALLEIIDDPELKKIYMVLEYAEAGEITWRKKGLPHICAYERRRQEREMRGEKPSHEEEHYDLVLERRQAIKDAKRAKMTQVQGAASAAASNYWSLEHGAEDDDNESLARSYGRDDSEALGRSVRSQPDSLSGSKATSRAPSRTHSAKSISRAGTPHPPLDLELASLSYDDDMETPGPLRSNPVSSTALEGTMYGPYAEDPTTRGRSPSMADSIISHMSSIDYNRIHDPYADDFSYVPCFTMEHARHTFRDTVLGLEYLHYEGVVHRDIKPPNLLQTKDYRVKISDFGVSYFGRPIRDGDETISESEAQDFDNDLELAKTVGTPAFFAPELCYTDSYDEEHPGVQPRITEQIDVWSLGVTLFCIVYARIPFIGEDEWHMFRKIATEEVYIPRRRLRPVDPATKPNEKSLYTRINRPPYRDDDELAYEDVDRDLIDLLTKMLVKNPEKRIRLRDVKRHPFVTKGITNVISWLDDTDPSRRTSGRKIQVDDREVARAVVPLTFLERARSAVKKAVGKVMHPRGERADSVSVSSRRRATSSAASSGGDSPQTGASMPNLRDARRKSIRPDDYFSTLSQASSEHPLTQSVVASPRQSPSDELPTSASQRQLSTSLGGQSSRQLLELVSNFGARDESLDRQHYGSTQRTFPRHGHHRSVTNAFLSLTANPSESRTTPATPLFDSQYEDPSSALRKARDMRPPSEDSNRARSVDRGLFASTDKRAEPKVSLSIAIAPGNVHFSLRPCVVPPIDASRAGERAAAPSPTVSFLTGYQNGQPQSEPNIYEKQRISQESDDRPSTARRVVAHPEARNPSPTPHKSSPLKSLAPVQTRIDGLRVDEGNRRVIAFGKEVEPAHVPCPPSPDDEEFDQCPLPPSREETIVTAMSSSSTSMGALAATPLTSPSETASPIYMVNPVSTKDITEQILAFQSDPSLPALLSSTSSVSADLEGEFLGNPGVVGRPSVIDTTDSLTPPAFGKESVSGFPLDSQEDVLQGAVPVRVKLDDHPVRPFFPTSADSVASQEECEDGDGEDSDSDEGLTMAKRKKSVAPPDSHSMGRMVSGSRRRDTNASIGSTETAKKVTVDSD
jgi:serine/threonine protein kinase